MKDLILKLARETPEIRKELFKKRVRTFKKMKKASIKEVQIQTPLKIQFIEREPWVAGFIRFPNLCLNKIHFVISLQPHQKPEDFNELSVGEKSFRSGLWFDFFKKNIKSLLAFAR